MADVPPTDDQLIAFLRVLAEHDGVAAHAADAMGISASAGRRWVKLAKTRGLTGKELTAEAKLRIALANANRDLKAAQREADTAERIRTEIYNLAARTPEPPKWLVPATKQHGSRGVPCTIWSDWHYGEVVRPEEIGGVNEFNADVAAARITRLVDTTIDLCFNHMGVATKNYPGIVVMLGGDML